MATHHDEAAGRELFRYEIERADNFPSSQNHGQAIADTIPGAKLLAMAGVGHELPDQELDTLAPAILEVTAGSSRR